MTFPVEVENSSKYLFDLYTDFEVWLQTWVQVHETEVWLKTPEVSFRAAIKAVIWKEGLESLLSVGLFKGQEVCQKDRPSFPENSSKLL